MFRRLFLWSERVKEIVANGLLYDFYGELLTEHQKMIYEEAVYNDMSLAEIAESYGISRQGVHDLIRRCTKTMQKYEDKLHMIKRFEEIRKETDALKLLAGDLQLSDAQFRKKVVRVTKRIDEVLEL